MAKEKKEKTISEKSLVLLKQASWDSFDNDYSWLHLYLQARADFPNFNVPDLFILSKIERLYETKLISKDIRDTLCELYLLRTNIEFKMETEDLDDDQWDEYQEKLDIADEILTSYGVAPKNMQELIDSTIEKSKYKGNKSGPILSMEQRKKLGMINEK